MEGFYRFFGHAFRMVDGEGVMAYGHFYASRCGEFGGMNLGTHSVFRSCSRDSAGFVGGKEACVTEHVDKIG